jgi:anti-sigma regulatory factor (Ser/Thr protein kinase)
MSFKSEKKNRIILYLLEKIDEKQTSVVKKTAESFGVTPATVYKYIDGLAEDGVLRKVKRGEYELVQNTETVILSRSRGELESEQAIYDRYMRPFMAELPENVIRIWEYMFGEMVNNVIDHSGAEHASITIVKDYLNTGVYIIDDGVGIFEKIRSYFGLGSVDEAVNELFKGKLTTDSANHSGEGIFFTSRIADEFRIVSSGKVFAHKRIEDGSVQDGGMRDGTAVYMSLSNHTRKRVRDVFDAFADVDGGFTKTIIAMRNYFDSSPVSRSQAKRLCNRLDRFKEVELDFEGMEWMGQGFAHQVFVVFKNEHPEVNIKPINMNEDVRRMYNHVILG